MVTMNPIHSEALDLRLMQWLDLLLQEGSVSRAALRADVTQSAMSHALRRMRQHFGDPLLIRAGQGMRLTPRALALREPLRELIQGLSRLAQGRDSFDPARGAHQFRLAMPDYGDLVLAPPLLRRLARQAPQARLHCLQPDSLDLLQICERVDLLIGSFGDAPQSLRQRVLWRDDFVVVAAAGHPRLRGETLDLPAFLAESHVLVSPTGLGRGPVDRWLAEHKLGRHIACSFSQFGSAARQVAGSALICTLPRRVARALAAQHPLRLFEAPLPLPGFDVLMLWRPELHQEARHAWLRQQVVAALRPSGSRSPGADAPPA